MLKADKSTTYTKTEVDTSLVFKADSSFSNWLEVVHSGNINTCTYTKTEVDTSLALKADVINNVPGTGERLLEANFLKRIFAVAPLQIQTYLNLSDPNDQNMQALSSVLIKQY